MLSTDHLTRLVLTKAEAERIWTGSSILREEFPTSGALWHFVRAVTEGHVKILTR
jgi:hypothetical protein